MPCAQMEDSADCCSFGAIPPLLPELPTANGVWDDVFLMMWTEPYGNGLTLPTVCPLPKDYMLFPSVARILASRITAGMT